jgi:hypothetical protein
VRLVDGGVPGRLVDGGVHHLFQFPQRLPHHVDVGDLQEAQLNVRVEALALVAAIFGLLRTFGPEGSRDTQIRGWTDGPQS